MKRKLLILPLVILLSACNGSSGTVDNYDGLVDRPTDEKLVTREEKNQDIKDLYTDAFSGISYELITKMDMKFNTDVASFPVEEVQEDESIKTTYLDYRYNGNLILSLYNKENESIEDIIDGPRTLGALTLKNFNLRYESYEDIEKTKMLDSFTIKNLTIKTYVVDLEDTGVRVLLDFTDSSVVTFLTNVVKKVVHELDPDLEKTLNISESYIRGFTGSGKYYFDVNETENFINKIIALFPELEQILSGFTAPTTRTLTFKEEENPLVDIITDIIGNQELIDQIQANLPGIIYEVLLRIDEIKDKYLDPFIDTFGTLYEANKREDANYHASALFNLTSEEFYTFLSTVDGEEVTPNADLASKIGVSTRFYKKENSENMLIENIQIVERGTYKDATISNSATIDFTYGDDAKFIILNNHQIAWFDTDLFALADQLESLIKIIK